jgi:hypothetical protein
MVPVTTSGWPAAYAQRAGECASASQATQDGCVGNFITDNYNVMGNVLETFASGAGTFAFHVHRQLFELPGNAPNNPAVTCTDQCVIDVFAGHWMIIIPISFAP